MTKKKVIVSGEFPTHQILWSHATLMRDLRIENQNGDAYVDVEEALACSMFLNIAFAIEAHANYLLEAAYPAEYEKERVFFSKGDYSGNLGKLRFLAEHLNVPLDRGSRPFQTVRELFKWRDFIVHNRVERQKYEMECTELSQIALPEPNSANFHKTLWADRTFEDAQKLCSSLQSTVFHDKRVKGVSTPEAFSGFLGTRGTQIISGES